MQHCVAPEMVWQATHISRPPRKPGRFTCIVIRIADGDTLTARCETPKGKTNITVRVAEIDASEKG